jgi:hypothetical protein
MPDETATFSITWDYLCPFARNAHEHVVAGLRTGAPWDVQFVPFSLKQVHVEEGVPAVWDRDDSEQVAGLLALLSGIAVRDVQPDRFLDAHVELFAARHDHGEDIREEKVVQDALARAGVDVPAVFAAINDGSVRDALRKEHSTAEDDDGVFGVPTFITGDAAAFVRLMHRPHDADDAIRTVGRVLDMMRWSDLNEFKHTRIPR